MNYDINLTKNLKRMKFQKTSQIIPKLQKDKSDPTLNMCTTAQHIRIPPKLGHC